MTPCELRGWKVGDQFITDTDTFTFRPEGKRMTDNFEELKRKELKRQLAETRAQVDRLEAELKRKEQWEPKGGEFLITQKGLVRSRNFPFKGQEIFGLCYPTRKQAERARDLMRVHNRALAYVQEHAPDWDGSDPHFMGWNNYMKKYSVFRGVWETPGTVYGPAWVILQLAEDVNSGRVVL